MEYEKSEAETIREINKEFKKYVPDMELRKAFSPGKEDLDDRFS